jgi:hypothetical protein
VRHCKCWERQVRADCVKKSSGRIGFLGGSASASCQAGSELGGHPEVPDGCGPDDVLDEKGLWSKAAEVGIKTEALKLDVSLAVDGRPAGPVRDPTVADGRRGRSGRGPASRARDAARKRTR